LSKFTFSLHLISTKSIFGHKFLFFLEHVLIGLALLAVAVIFVYLSWRSLQTAIRNSISILLLLSFWIVIIASIDYNKPISKSKDNLNSTVVQAPSAIVKDQIQNFTFPEAKIYQSQSLLKKLNHSAVFISLHNDDVYSLDLVRAVHFLTKNLPVLLVERLYPFHSFW